MLKEEKKTDININELLNKPFNIEEYYQENEKIHTGERNIALQIITEDQNIGCHTSGNFRHEQLLREMHKYIYGNSQEYFEGNHFEEYSKNKDCVIIRYLEPMSLPYVYIHLPEEINKFQKEEIIKMYKQIAKINELRNDDNKIKTSGLNNFGRESIVNTNFVNLVDILLPATKKTPYKR